MSTRSEAVDKPEGAVVRVEMTSVCRAPEPSVKGRVNDGFSSKRGNSETDS